MEDSSVIIYRDYGDVNIDIKKLMDQKGLTVTQMVKRTGLHHKVIKKYYERTAVRFDREVLSKLCFVLNCEIQDILKYERPIEK